MEENLLVWTEEVSSSRLIARFFNEKFKVSAVSSNSLR